MSSSPTLPKISPQVGPDSPRLGHRSSPSSPAPPSFSLSSPATVTTTAPRATHPRTPMSMSPTAASPKSDVSIAVADATPSPLSASIVRKPSDIAMLSPTSSAGSPSPAAASTTKLPALIMIDNDECIGSWGDLSMLYTMYTHVLRKVPSIDLFARLLTETGCARPGLRELYDSCLELKKQGRVAAVYMVTAARDTVGWVSFLHKVLEKWYGQKVYDGVIEGSMLIEWNKEHGNPVLPLGGCIWKDMNQVRKMAGVPVDTPVISIDDRPENIINGTPHSVTPYVVAVNLVEVARAFMAEWDATLEHNYAATLQETWRAYQRDPSQFTVAWRDTQMMQAAESVRAFVDQVAPEADSVRKSVGTALAGAGGSSGAGAGAAAAASTAAATAKLASLKVSRQSKLAEEKQIAGDASMKNLGGSPTSRQSAV